MRFLVTFLSILIAFSLGTLAKQITIKSCDVEFGPGQNPILYPSSIKPIFTWWRGGAATDHPSMTNSDHHFWVSSNPNSNSESEDAQITFTNIPDGECQCTLIFLNPAKEVFKIGGNPIVRVLEPKGSGEIAELNLLRSRSAGESISCTEEMTFTVGIRPGRTDQARYVSFYRSKSFLRWGQPPEGWALEQSCGTETETPTKDLMD
ncbi:MAG: hypothetical protein M1813_001722 [Trichoglossum hirsutum]|jgi:hypothetical protein|nr:MAG: hypothetical protein M1813_001722 [Trichoglossum hirsutum]